MGLVQIYPHEGSISATVLALEALTAQAKAGKIIGVAYVVMHHGLDYSVGAAGETRVSPTFTRGMLHLLDEELSKLIRAK